MADDERGQAAGIEAVPFGLLVLVVGATLLGSAWAVVDVKLAVVAAAREGARAAAESDSFAEADAAARSVALDVLAGHGRDEGEVTLTIDGDGFRRCAPLQVRVVQRAPALSIPWVGRAGGVEVAATHGEVVDPFREGIAGGEPVAC